MIECHPLVNEIHQNDLWREQAWIACCKREVTWEEYDAFCEAMGWYDE